MYHDMVVIREFETMLNTIKTKGAWEGIAYDHLGPAHLSIGQEAAVVGQSAPLGIEDFIFGSHRSHGEILAKCLAAAARLPEKDVGAVMESYLGGDPLRVVQKDHRGTLRDLALDYVIYGVLAEIFGRAYGFNRGLGGSMHAFFAPFGSMPNNAIVGGSADIAVGACALQAHQPAARHRDRQHRRRLVGVRPRVGGPDARGHGPVPDAVAEGGGRRAPDPVQFLQ